MLPMRLALLLTLALTAPSALGAQWISGAYTNAWGSRGFNAYIPSGYVAGTPVPMVVAIHGCTQDPVSFAGATNYNALAEAQKFIVLYPNQAAAWNPAQCWNVQYTVNHGRGTGEPSLIKGMVDWIKARYAVDAKRVFVTGFSSGGAMASIMLACYPDVFAAGSVNAGLMYAASESDAEQASTLLNGSARDPNQRGQAAYACGNSLRLPRPVIVFHGTWDAVVNPFNGNQAIAQFAQTNDYADDGANNNSVTATWASQTQGQVTNGRAYHVNNFVAGGRTLMQEVRVYGMGHAWSGGVNSFGNADATGPNATQMQWNFFLANPRP